MPKMTIAPIDKPTAKRLIVENHYSKKWNTSFGRYNLGCFSPDGVLRGVAVYGNLMNPGSYGRIADVPSAACVIELNRLWLDDFMGHNSESQFLAMTFRWLKGETPVRVVQSFADGRLGAGTIYKASNFGYYGHTETLFYRHRPTGEVYHHAPFDNTARPTPFVQRNYLWALGELDPFTVKNYRYIRGLDKPGRKAIRLPEEPYPPYDKGETPVKGHDRGVRALVRAEIVAGLTGKDEERHVIADFVRRNYPPDQIATARELANGNRWVTALRAGTPLSASRRSPQ